MKNIVMSAVLIVSAQLACVAEAQTPVPYVGINDKNACPIDSNAVELNAGKPLDENNAWPTDCINCLSHAIMVTDPSVVGEMKPGQAPEAPGNPAWELRHLLKEIGGVRGPGSAIGDILESFGNEQTINGDTVAARTDVATHVLTPWQEAANVTKLDDLVKALNGNGEAADAAWSAAPFKLVAIGYRPDLILRDMLLKNAISGGEGRFIFQFFDKEKTFEKPLLLIFEYALPATSSIGATSWATRYDALRKLPFGPKYNEELARITRDFTDRKLSHAGPNNVSLGQIRTNEFINRPWELREFRLAENGNLIPSTVKMNPALKFNEANTATLIRFLQTEFAGSFPTATIPWLFEDEAFLAGSAITPNSFVGGSGPVNTWLANTQLPSDLTQADRHRFASATCSGCHGGDAIRTSTPSNVLVPEGFFLTGFTHVDARGARFGHSKNGQALQSILSDFLCSADLVERVRAMTVWRSESATAKLLAALPAVGIDAPGVSKLRLASEARDSIIPLPGKGGLVLSVPSESKREKALLDQGIEALLQNVTRTH